MSRRDPRVSFRHMLDNGQKAVSLVEGRTRAAVEADELRFLAPVRLLEVVGDAAGRVPVEVRERHPDIPWRDVVGLRNRLIHGYDTINRDLFWRVLSEDLPRLLPRLEAALDKEP